MVVWRNRMGLFCMKGSCQETKNEDQNQKSCGPETAIQHETLEFVNEG
jgi:hypothetical protein